MKHHAELQAWLPTARHVQYLELLKVVAIDGTTWRYTDGEDLYYEGANWSGSALQWSRSSLSFVAGIEVSDCTLTIIGGTNDRINSQPVGAALRSGIWDGATVTILRAYFDAGGVLRGVLPRFSGNPAGTKLAGGEIQLTVKAKGEVFNRSVPAVYQAGCHNTLFDTGCGLDRSAWQVAGVLPGGSSTRTVITGRGESAGWFTAGVLLFTDGALAGLRRTVKQHLAGGALTLFDALPIAPPAGSAFVLTPGCNRTTGAGGCAKFNNIIRFRGTPFIPEPEASL